MAIDKSNSQTQKITVTLPSALIARLDAHVPPRQRSRFIAKAVESRLAIEEQMIVVEETAGIWTEESHPELKTEKDIDAWLRKLRSA